VRQAGTFKILEGIVVQMPDILHRRRNQPGAVIRWQLRDRARLPVVERIRLERDLARRRAADAESDHSRNGLS
jgi:hypothetical protein